MKLSEAVTFTKDIQQELQREEYPGNITFSTDRNGEVVGAVCRVDTRNIEGQKQADEIGNLVSKKILDVCNEQGWKFHLITSGHTFIVNPRIGITIRHLQERYDY